MKFTTTPYHGPPALTLQVMVLTSGFGSSGNLSWLFMLTRKLPFPVQHRSDRPPVPIMQPARHKQVRFKFAQTLRDAVAGRIS